MSEWTKNEWAASSERIWAFSRSVYLMLSSVLIGSTKAVLLTYR